MPRILFVTLLFILILPIHAQVGTWTNIPVLTEIRSIQPAGGEVFLATDGGVFTFNPNSGEFDQGVNGLPSENLDATVLYLDSDSLLWIGAKSPGPVVEVFDLRDGSQVPVEYVNLDQITSFTEVGDSVYATYTDGIEGGLLLYRKGEGRIEYLDQFSQFPANASVDLNMANDLIYMDDKLVFRTQRFIFWSTLGSTNLKDPQNWSFSPIPYLRNSLNGMVARNDTLILAVDNTIYEFDLVNMNAQLEAAAEITGLSKHSGPDRVIFSTASKVHAFDPITGTSNALQTVSGVGSMVSDQDEIWVASTGHFLSLISEGPYATYSANRPRDHLFNRMLVNAGGDLVAGARGGISMLTQQGWRTAIASSTAGSFDQSLYDWNTMITDTLAYVGSAVVEDMILDQEDNIYLALQGRGVLKVDGNLTGESKFYTAANDVLEPTFDSENYVLTGQMAVDSENNIFMTNKLIRDGGSSITILTPEDSVYHIMHESIGLDSRSVKSIAIDENDLIWVGSQIRAELQQTGGIHFIGRTGLFGNGVEEVAYLSGSPLASNEILQLEVDQNNTLWILTTSGVQSMQLPQKWLTSSELRNWANLYMSDTYWQLTDFNVTAIEIDQRGNRWFLSSNAGVHVYQQNGRWINDGYGYNTSNSDLSDNAVYALAFNSESGDTYMSTGKGISVLKTPFADPKPDYSEMHIYPQPFNPDIHEQVIIQGLMDNSSIKILTVSGGLVRELSAEESEVLGYEAQWDGLDDAGDIVGSGVYLLYIFNEDGTSASQKIAVIR